MVHQGGVTSRTSRALANVRQQLKTKQTRGRKPRVLTDAELAKLEDQQDDLLISKRTQQSAQKGSAVAREH